MNLLSPFQRMDKWNVFHGSQAPEYFYLWLSRDSILLAPKSDCLFKDEPERQSVGFRESSDDVEVSEINGHICAIRFPLSFWTGLFLIH